MGLQIWVTARSWTCSQLSAKISKSARPFFLGTDQFPIYFLIQVEDDDVCAGLVGQQGPIIAYDLRSISTTGQQGTKLCNALLGLCAPPAVNEYMVTFPKPAPTQPKIFISTGRPPIQVTHFSDVHIDREYTVYIFSLHLSLWLIFSFSLALRQIAPNRYAAEILRMKLVQLKILPVRTVMANAIVQFLCPIRCYKP
jgi:hypothetical protein